MDTFGDNLYNLYGSTEVAWATIATPEDMRAAPGTAGKPPRGTVVKLFDENGVEVPPGETGRIFVGNEMLFEGYTGGGSKDVIDGLMATGDVGRMDDAGRLFVEGRDDEMIVSGGENLFPKEVEDTLARHPACGGGGRDRRRGRAIRPAPARVRGVLRQGRAQRGRAEEVRQEEPGWLQGAARDLVPRRAPPQRHRQGAQAGAAGDGAGAEVAVRGRFEAAPAYVAAGPGVYGRGSGVYRRRVLTPAESSGQTHRLDTERPLEHRLTGA